MLYISLQRWINQAHPVAGAKHGLRKAQTPQEFTTQPHKAAPPPGSSCTSEFR